MSRKQLFSRHSSESVISNSLYYGKMPDRKLFKFAPDTKNSRSGLTPERVTRKIEHQNQVRSDTHIYVSS